MTPVPPQADHYAGAAQPWADGAAIVYRPLAEQLVASTPHALGGRTVADLGAGTGVASTILRGLGARPVAFDYSHDMLAWDGGARPPSAVADVTALPVRDASVDDAVAAFVFNHLTAPEAGIAEAVRVVRPGGALLACVYANASRSDARDVLDAAAGNEGWRAPPWYLAFKEHATPLLGTADDMAAAATRCGLVDVATDERAVDVGVTEPEQLVDYRLGQAHFSAWITGMDPGLAAEVRDRLVAAVRPVMRPFEPVVVFLSACVPFPAA